MLRHPRQSGFTLVEIGVIVPILMIIALAMFQILYQMVQSSDEERARIGLAYTNEQAMNQIESDVRLTSSFTNALDNGIVDPYQSYSSGSTWSPNGSTSGSHTTRTLIIRAYSTTANPESTTRTAIYIGDASDPQSCDADRVVKDDVLTYNIIYFVSNGTLYKRTVTDNGLTYTCSSEYQKISCPPASSLPSARDGNCKADDEVIATNVTDFNIDYYSTGSSTAKLTTYGTPTVTAAVKAAKSVDVTLTQTAGTAGDPVSATIELRMATINADVTG